MPGFLAGVEGINKLTNQPASAVMIMTTDTQVVPLLARISKPPNIVPAKIAKKVPASISAFPSINSCLSS